MDIWSLTEVEKALENKTLDEFKLWIAEEMVKEDLKMTRHHQKEAMAKKLGEKHE